jgi:hypothetical protein
VGGLPDDLIGALRQRANDPSMSIDMADLVPHRMIAPASAEEVRRVETALGIGLPKPLEDLYTRTANGGFGPGYGLLGLDGGARDDLGQAALDIYTNFARSDPEDPIWVWRESVLPICYWGCVVYSCVDCSTPDARIVGFDEGRWVQDDRPLEVWLRQWLGGGVAQPTAAGS